MLTISDEKLAFIIAKAKQFEAEVPPVDQASGSNPTDDGAVDVLEDADNPTDTELSDALSSLNADEKDELMALVWLGRGDFGKDEWSAGLAQAREERGSGDMASLMEIPLLAEYLEAGAAEFETAVEDADDRSV